MKPTAEVLRNLYQVEQLSMREIGVLYEVTAEKVRKWLVQDSISIRVRGHGPAAAARRRGLSSRPYDIDGVQATDEVIRRLYEDEQMSLHEIGRRFGSQANVVRRWLERAGVPRRSASEATILGMRNFVPSEEHKAKLRENIKMAVAAKTPESYRKQAEKMKGRSPWNKGKPWSDEYRASFAARQTPEYRRMLSAAAKKGAESHAWRGGHESRSPRGIEWQITRQACYERDKWICQDCGCHCQNKKDSANNVKRRIQAHHIIPRRLGGNDDLSNLVTLCASCHGKRERAGQNQMIL